MKSKILISGMLMASALFFSASASAITLNLDGLLTDQSAAYIENGFSLVAPGEHLHQTGDPVALVFAAEMANDTAGMLLTKVGGGAFSFESLFNISLAGTGMHVDGLLGGASVVSTMLVNGAQKVETFLANNSAWGNVDAVQFWYDDAGAFGNLGDGSVAASFDNFHLRTIVVDAAVSSVPVPAAVWLFMSALGGLGAMRRKQILVA